MVVAITTGGKSFSSLNLSLDAIGVESSTTVFLVNKSLESVATFARMKHATEHFIEDVTPHKQ